MSSVPGYSFEFYRRVIITTPIVGPLVIFPIILAVNFVCGCINKSHDKILTKLAEKFSFGDEKKYYLHQERPLRFIFVLLVVKGTLILMFSLAVFLNESVIANEIGCLSGHWDCFAQSNAKQFGSQTVPILVNSQTAPSSVIVQHSSTQLPFLKLEELLLSRR